MYKFDKLMNVNGLLMIVGFYIWLYP